MLSIVIPTLNSAGELGGTLAALAGDASDPPFGEIVIADGGSTDGTLAQARAAGAVVVSSAASRGVQLRRGGETATGDWLLFLHADTVLGAGWRDEAAEFIAGTGNRERAATFRFVLSDTRPAARRLERIVAWRCRRLGLPYGDQGLLLSRSYYDHLGGYRPLALMEDVDLVRRIGRRRLTLFETPAHTSAKRYQRRGYLPRSARNLFCLLLYFLGVPDRTLARFYG